MRKFFAAIQRAALRVVDAMPIIRCATCDGQIWGEPATERWITEEAMEFTCTRCDEAFAKLAQIAWA